MLNLHRSLLSVIRKEKFSIYKSNLCQYKHKQISNIHECERIISALHASFRVLTFLARYNLVFLILY